MLYPTYLLTHEKHILSAFPCMLREEATTRSLINIAMFNAQLFERKESIGNSSKENRNHCRINFFVTQKYWDVVRLLLLKFVIDC